MSDDIASSGPYQEFQELAARWDLIGLHDELLAILHATPEHERPAVPTRLATAVHWFLESYGADSIFEDGCS